MVKLLIRGKVKSTLFTNIAERQQGPRMDQNFNELIQLFRERLSEKCARDNPER